MVTPSGTLACKKCEELDRWKWVAGGGGCWEGKGKRNFDCFFEGGGDLTLDNFAYKSYLIAPICVGC